jgi:hypothetical protein
MESTKHEVSNYTKCPTTSCYFVPLGFKYYPHAFVPSSLNCSLPLSRHSSIKVATGGITRLANLSKQLNLSQHDTAAGANSSYAKRPWPQQDISLRLPSRSVGAQEMYTNYELASVQLFRLREQIVFSGLSCFVAYLRSSRYTRTCEWNDLSGIYIIGYMQLKRMLQNFQQMVSVQFQTLEKYIRSSRSHSVREKLPV